MIILWKSLASMFIFFTLFVSSWWLNDTTKRPMYTDANDISPTNMMHDTTVQHDQLLMIEPFQPREYIKILENI